MSWNWRQDLIECTKRLAASPDEQIRYLKNLGTYPLVDELALEFADVAGVATQKRENGEITDVQYQVIERLDAMLDQFSSSENSDLWTPEALRHAEEWHVVRQVANEALAVLSK